MKGISLVAIMLLQLVILHEGIRLSNANVLVKSGKNNQKWPGKSNNSCPVNPKVEAMKKLLAGQAKNSSQSQRYSQYGFPLNCLHVASIVDPSDGSHNIHTGIWDCCDQCRHPHFSLCMQPSWTYPQFLRCAGLAYQCVCECREKVLKSKGRSVCRKETGSCKKGSVRGRCQCLENNCVKL